MKASQGIKPQDILVVLKILSLRRKPWRAIDVAHDLGISPSEVSMALGRARRVGFLDEARRNVMTAPVFEFLVHGLKYVFPAELGPMCRGIPTAHSAPRLSRRIISEEHDQCVWPSEEGTLRGQAVPPLYKTAPHAATRDPQLHELLALVDALRIGRARERKIAAQEMEKRLRELALFGLSGSPIPRARPARRSAGGSSPASRGRATQRRGRDVRAARIVARLSPQALGPALMRLDNSC